MEEGRGSVSPEAKERLDLLVQRLAGVSRSKAQGLIRTGAVSDADGNKLDKPGLRLPVDTRLLIAEGPRYVSRGGEKLEAALTAFSPPIAGRDILDVGASTGGFTDCLLQHGAARVFAVDVGYGQLAWRLRQDPRVVVFERTNIRALRLEALPGLAAFFVADCSFISLRLVLPAVAPLLQPDAGGIVLIKPQFEAGPDQVSRGGVVRDPAVRDRVVDEVLGAARAHGLAPNGVIPSPLLGPAGNVEFLAYLVRDDVRRP